MRLKISRRSARLVNEYMKKRNISYINEAVDRIIDEWIWLREGQAKAGKLLKEVAAALKTG